MTPDETEDEEVSEAEKLNTNFALINGHLAYNKELLHQLVMALLSRTDDDGDVNYDAAFAARKEALKEFEIAYESHGKSGREMLEIRERIQADYANKT